jgi:hypothetical protein
MHKASRGDVNFYNTGVVTKDGLAPEAIFKAKFAPIRGVYAYALVGT